MALTRTNKNNPCPVCNGTSKGCSYDLSTEVYLCRGSHTNEGFKLTKYDNNKLFGIYVKDLGKEKTYTAEEKAAWLAEKKAKEQAEAERFAALLDRDTRNAKYQALSKELGLFSRDNDNLIDRGFEDGFDAGFRSVKKYQKVSCDVKGIAGFNHNNKYVGKTGILCPIRDVQDRLLGYQVATGDKEGKYLWLKSGEASSHLQNRELPINVAKYGTADIGFCEGILKSTVGANRHSMTLIGASTIGSTPHQIKEVIDYFQLTQVKLFVDSGSAINSNVASVISNFNDVVTGFGCDVLIADWGHWFDKLSGDIDEIDTLEHVSFKSFAFFKACCQDASNYEVETPQIVLDTKNELSGLLKSNTRVTREVSLTQTAGEWIKYETGNLEEPSENAPANYIFDGLATGIYEEALLKGYKVILDTSETGSGKTKAASEINVEGLKPCGVNKLIYCSKTPRSVNNEMLEQHFVKVPSRHAGYDYDRSKLTPLGNPTLIPTEKAKPDVASNCKFLNLFSLARSKNVEIDVCGKCNFKKDCRKGRGNGYGYKSEMKFTSQANRLRGTVIGLSDSTVDGKTLLVVDEYTQSVPWVKTVRINSKDVQSVLGNIYKIYQEEDSDLFGFENPEAKVGIDILTKLQTLLTVSETNPRYKFGISLDNIMKALRLEQYDSEALKGLVTVNEVKTGQDNEDHFTQVNSKQLGSEEMIEQLLTPQWLRIFIDCVIRNNVRSSVTISKGVLCIESVDQRILDNLGNSFAVIYQDATGSKQDLAMKLGISVDSILEMKQSVAERKPTVLNQVLGLNQAGNRRSESTQKRIDSLRRWFYKNYGQNNVGCIDFKKFAKPGDLVHFVDGRGSNAFQHKELVVSFGLPVKNLTALQSEYQVFSGNICTSLEDEGFQVYLSDSISAEVIQEAGRLRANRRPDEDLEYVVVSDSDLNFMSSYGFKVEKTHVMHYIPEAGSRAERTRLVVLDAITAIVEKNPDQSIKNLTQAQVIQEAKISQTRLSRLAKKFGGWEDFKNVIELTIKGNKGEEINSEDEKAVAMAKVYLPYVLENCLVEPDSVDNLIDKMPENTSEKHWDALFADINPYSASKFISNLVEALPGTIKRDFVINLRNQYKM